MIDSVASRAQLRFTLSTGLGGPLLRHTEERPLLFLIAAWAPTEQEYAALQRMLSEDELKRGDRFRFERDRNTFLLARGVLRVILAELLDLTPKDVSFTYDKNGKPHLSQDCNLSFNLSHSESGIAVGVTAGGRVGVDLEKATDVRAMLETSRIFLTKTECAALQQHPGNRRYEHYFRLWTLKEAYLKARGDGLSIPLDSFAFDLSEHELSFFPPKDDTCCWRFDQGSIWGNYVWAMAQERSVGVGLRAPNVIVLGE